MNADPADTGEATLAELSLAWQTFGCAVCGQVTRPDAAGGWRIELHHLKPRSQGGGDEPENLMGLCGELLPNKCHWRVTNHRLTLVNRDDVGWVWDDGVERGLCRPLVLEMARETGLDRALTHPTGHAKGRALVVRPIPADRVSSVAEMNGFEPGDLLGAGQKGAEKRFEVGRQLNHRAERTWMALAVVIQKGMQMRDAQTLGFDSYTEWGEAMGIHAGVLSKLRTIGKQFGGRWEFLPEADKKQLSMEGLYVCARMVKHGEWTEDEALSECVAQPVHRLWSQLKDVEEMRRHGVIRHACPTCGDWHLPKSHRRARDQED